MRKTLLSFVALALCSVGAWAQSWVAPTLEYSAGEIPSAAYFYHVGQGMFLTKGTTWGTHAALTASVKDALLYEIQDQGDGSYKLYCSAADQTGYLGRSTDTHIYTDTKSSATTWDVLYEFYKAESGYYHIRTAAGAPNYGADRYTEDDPVNYGLWEMGWNANNEDLDKSDNPIGTNVGIFFLDATLPDLQLDWAFVTPATYELYSAKTALYEKLNDAIEAGYSESELASQAALLSSSDLDAVNEALVIVDKMVLNYAYDHATPENPYDITASVVVNPTFEGARGAAAAGWTDEFGNMLIQNNSAYVIYDEYDQATEEYGLQNFAQNWTSSNSDPIAPSNIYQVIADLPQGTYLLTADCIATSGSSALEVSGPELYAESGEIHYSCPIDRNPYGGVGSGNPRRYTLTITHQGGDLKIGYGFKAGYVKWFACDNFKLYYAGPVDNPGLLALSATMNAAKPYVSDYDDLYIYSGATYDALSEELDNAESILSGTSDECMDEVKVISGIMAQVKAEIVAYKNLDAFVARVFADMSTYASVASLSDNLSNMYDEYIGKYEDRKATIEEIEQWIAGYDAVILQGVKDAIPTATEENPVDITVLGVNLGWTSNTDEGWTHSSTTGHWNTRAQAAEVWQSNFSCLQTIHNLPAGKYIVTANAFSRTQDYAIASMEDEVVTVLVANFDTAPVCNALEGLSTTQYYSNDHLFEADGTYVPNSMEGASVAFGKGLYKCQVSTYLATDGDLTVGIKNEGNVPDQEWSIWSNFHILYCGTNNSELYNSLVSILNQAADYVDLAASIEEADNRLNSAINNGENLSESSSEEELTNAIVDLENAIQYTIDGVELVKEVMAAHQNYMNLMAQVEETSDESFGALLDLIGEAVADEYYESNEKMQEWLDELPVLWTKHLQCDHLDASPEHPADATFVIVNPSFATNDASGWTYTNDGGSIGGGDAQRVGSTAYEAWNSKAFDIHQTIRGLAEGTYRLSVKALYRDGNNDDATLKRYLADPETVSGIMQLYANDASTNVVSYYSEGLTEAPGIAGETSYVLDGVTYYGANTMMSFEDYAMIHGLYNNTMDVYVAEGEDLTIGLRFQTPNANAWAPFDDFQLFYLGSGNNTGTAIENVVATVPVNSAIYDLQGRRVSKAVRGMYIIGGKKYIVK